MTDDLFEKAPIPKAYFALTLPVLGSGLSSLIYSLADTWFVSRSGITELVAGVSLCAPMLTIMTALGDIYGLGGSSVISRLFGKKRVKEGGDVCSFSFYAGLLTGLAYALLLFVFRKQILTLFGVGSDTWAYACPYYTVLILGAPFSVLHTDLGNIMRTDAMGTQAFIGQGSGCLLNIILDPIFIFTLHMGAAGAALATVLGKVFAVVILVLLTAKKSTRLSVSLSRIRIPKKETAALFAIGIPAALTNILNSLITAVTNHMLLPYGTSAVAAMGIVQKVTMVILIVSACFTFGCQPLLGYCFGASLKERLRQSIRFDILVQIVIALSFILLLAPLAPQIMRCFLDTPEIVRMGSQMLRFLLPSCLFQCLNTVFITLFQSEGKPMPALIMSLFRQGVLYCLLIVILNALLGYYGILLTTLCTEVLGLGLAVVLYRITNPNN